MATRCTAVLLHKSIKNIPRIHLLSHSILFVQRATSCVHMITLD